MKQKTAAAGSDSGRSRYVMAFMLSGGMRSVLERTSLAVKSNRVNLVLPADGSVLAGDVVERRLKALAEVLDVNKAGILEA